MVNNPFYEKYIRPITIREDLGPVTFDGFDRPLICPVSLLYYLQPNYIARANYLRTQNQLKIRKGFTETIYHLPAKNGRPLKEFDEEEIVERCGNNVSTSQMKRDYQSHFYTINAVIEKHGGQAHIQE